MPTDRLEAFKVAWGQPREKFFDYVRGVSRTYFDTRLGLEGAATLVQASPAELAAILELATLDDEDLKLLSNEIPPKTTWFAFADADRDGVEAGLDALRKKRPGASAHASVRDAVRSVSEPSPIEAVAALPGNTVLYMAAKAKAYDLLGTKGRKALYQFGQQKKRGVPLSPKQVAYLHDLLVSLVEGGAVNVQSADNDQGECDAVLKALGR